MANQYGEATKMILKVLAAGGFVVLAITMPKVAVHFGKIILRHQQQGRKRYDNKKITELLQRLRRKGVIILKEKGDGNFVIELTQKGRKKVEEINIEEMEIMKQKIWDKKWRIVIFDIPETRKLARNALRSKMKELKFYQLQKSVFVCPYPCEKEILFLCEFFEVFKFVDIIIAEKIHNDAVLRRVFKL